MKTITLIICLLACACNTVSNSNSIMSDLIYVKDTRTNLCFATAYAYSNNAVMSNIPCTPEVEQIIKIQGTK